jgi:hypothetical protein
MCRKFTFHRSFANRGQIIQWGRESWAHALAWHDKNSKDRDGLTGIYREFYLCFVQQNKIPIIDIVRSIQDNYLTIQLSISE